MRPLKACYFGLTAMNTLAATWFLNYLFFFLRGKFGQRRGFIASLKLGFGGLAVTMTIGALMYSVPGILIALAGYTIVLLFTWPALEALVSENETQAGVLHNVGIYNCTWASAAAVAYFTGGG